ncbi:hypothetical protein [Pseudoalteromonas agarivorans]|uniref:Uncharacterized protein n=1 Tax=Pseudoalteromonas agarivorans DSM 14585 TaxID=1312369 RepID=A0ACA8E288_9GAMM|nr:hypothetical protein [Pseudoalteromonas agarivorans]ATC84355.1 hypothetical protein PAGA_b0439 [Pseudoalteromonas agarivorans DSM 14585]
MKKLLLLIAFTLSISIPSIAQAKDELVIIQKESKEGKKREDFFYLIGTRSRGKPANFTLWRNQFYPKKNWNGLGSPALTIEEAVSRAKEYYKAEGELQLIELELRLGYSVNSTVWYYLIDLAKPSDITERGVESELIYTVVVLTSGEVLPPYTPK